jgi:glycosyltransferase involved in cell wall biosynthesis
MATLNRKDEVDSFLKTLLIQTYKDFELIIADQNQDDKIFDIFLRYKNKINIKYIRSNQKGLSHNRNLGLRECIGDIIAFPDDDCEYRCDTLEKAVSFLKTNPEYSFYTCNVKDKNGNDSILSGNRTDTEISLANFMSTAISFTIFIRAESIFRFKFDERLGVGARYGSGEESDLLLFLISNNKRGFYHADTYICHPNSLRNPDKLYSYGKGFGALYKKAVIVYHFYSFFFKFLLILIKEFIKIILFPSEKERITTMKGRIYGFINYPN